MRAPQLPPFRPRTREQWEAVEALAWGRARAIMMGRDPRINRLARHLAVFARPMPKAIDRFERRIVLTPAEARRLNAPR